MPDLTDRIRNTLRAMEADPAHRLAAMHATATFSDMEGAMLFVLTKLVPVAALLRRLPDENGQADWCAEECESAIRRSTVSPIDKSRS